MALRFNLISPISKDRYRVQLSVLVHLSNQAGHFKMGVWGVTSFWSQVAIKWNCSFWCWHIDFNFLAATD